MIHSNIFTNRIQVQTKTDTRVATGRNNEAWTTVDTVWSSILEKPITVVDWDQNQSSMKYVKITIRGRKNYDISITRFITGTSIYKPVSSSYLASRTDTQFTVYHCHQIDGVTQEAVTEDAPTIVSTSPEDADTGVLITANLTIEFSKPVVFNPGNFTLMRKSNEQIITFASEYDDGSYTVTLNPASSLIAAQEYILIISGVVDMYNNYLASTETISFTTAG